ncbi:MAG: hypothetical protein IGS38_14760 [Synechococcales cyanobacterium M58_A2018_015]|nr:hypothetical protein [Synechococcales cyanobacterium M58_A2018_015]
MIEATLATLPLTQEGQLQPVDAATPPEPPEPDRERAVKTSYLPGMQRRVGVVAGVAVVVTTGVTATVISQAPEYEGKFQLAIAPAASETASETATEPAIPQPQIQDMNQRIDLPSPEVQAKILKSPRFIDPTLEQLRPHLSDLDYQTLTQKLRIRVNPDHTVDVRYRDDDPQRVQLVLEKLAQVYVQSSQDCQDRTCKGIAHIEAQLPTVKQQITDLRQQVREFRQQHNLTNQDAQIREFASRTAEIAKQRAELEGKLAEARDHYSELQQRMAMQPNESVAMTLLSKDSPYLNVLQQLRAIDTEIAQELGRLDIDRDRVQQLAVRYQATQNQLYQEAPMVLQRHLTNPQSNLQDPIFQDPTYLNLIQQSLSTIAYVQTLDHRYQMLLQTEQTIQQQTEKIAGLLRQYADLQQQLQAETRSLQSYFDQLEILKAEATPPTLEWQLAAAPTLREDALGKPAPIMQDLKRDIRSGAILGLVMGVGVAAALEPKNRWKSSPV